MRCLTTRAFFFLALLLTTVSAHAQPAAEPTLKCVPTEQCFCVRPALEPVIQQQVNDIRGQITRAHNGGKSVGYLSVPLSGTGHATYFVFGKWASGKIKEALESRFGSNYVFVIDPGSVTLTGPDGQNASQGEYLYLWAKVLAGTDGLGQDLDFVYFTGPTDFATVFGASEPDRLGNIGAFFDRHRRDDTTFDDAVKAGKVNREEFVRYFGFSASAAFSRGCHDEWNVVTSVNRRRVHLASDFGIPKLLPVWFDGRQVAPPEMTSAVDFGNATTSCTR